MGPTAVKVKMGAEWFDVTEFLQEHPGGAGTISHLNGEDITEQFEGVGHSTYARTLLDTYRIAPPETSSANVAAPKESTALNPSTIQQEKEDELHQIKFLDHPVTSYVIFSVLMAAIFITTAFHSSDYFAEFVNAHPSRGEAGLGRFEIRGYNSTFNFAYPWRLVNPTVASRITAWIGYSLHQLGQWWIMALVTRDRHKIKGYATKPRPLNRYMDALNMFFIGYKLVQSHLFYDGLAQDVPEVTALASVAMFLSIIIAIEMPRRGLLVGNIVRFKWYTNEFFDFVKRYHGYIISFGIVYDFHYHPCEATAGHFLGFMYQFMLFFQSSNFLTTAHINRYWTFVLEVFVVFHGAITAITQGGTGWMTFTFGFGLVAVVTQTWGLPVFVQMRRTYPRARLAILISLMLVVAGCMVTAFTINRALPLGAIGIFLFEIALVVIYYICFVLCALVLDLFSRCGRKSRRGEPIPVMSTDAVEMRPTEEKAGDETPVNVQEKAEQERKIRANPLLGRSPCYVVTVVAMTVAVNTGVLLFYSVPLRADLRTHNY